jgi:hypothetical protein
MTIDDEVAAGIEDIQSSLEEGNARLAILSVKQLEWKVKKVGGDVYLGFLRLKHRAYADGIKILLDEADKMLDAKAPDTAEALTTLSTLSRYAHNADLPIPSRVSTLYLRGLGLTIGEAERHLKGGSIELVPYAVARARDFAGRAGVEIPPILEELEVGAQKEAHNRLRKRWLNEPTHNEWGAGYKG